MLVQYVQNENKSKKGGAPNWKECARILSKKFHKERTPSQCCMLLLITYILLILHYTGLYSPFLAQHWYVQSSHDQTLDLNCRNRVANPKIDKGPWRKAEDEKLLGTLIITSSMITKLIELYDLHNGSWAKISKALGNRPGMMASNLKHFLIYRYPMQKKI